MVSSNLQVLLSLTSLLLLLSQPRGAESTFKGLFSSDKSKDGGFWSFLKGPKDAHKNDDALESTTPLPQLVVPVWKTYGPLNPNEQDILFLPGFSAPTLDQSRPLYYENYNNYQQFYSMKDATSAPNVPVTQENTVQKPAENFEMPNANYHNYQQYYSIKDVKPVVPVTQANNIQKPVENFESPFTNFHNYQQYYSMKDVKPLPVVPVTQENNAQKPVENFEFPFTNFHNYQQYYSIKDVKPLPVAPVTQTNNIQKPAEMPYVNFQNQQQYYAIKDVKPLPVVPTTQENNFHNLYGNLEQPYAYVPVSNLDGFFYPKPSGQVQHSNTLLTSQAPWFPSTTTPLTYPKLLSQLMKATTAADTPGTLPTATVVPSLTIDSSTEAKTPQLAQQPKPLPFSSFVPMVVLVDPSSLGSFFEEHVSTSWVNSGGAQSLVPIQWGRLAPNAYNQHLAVEVEQPQTFFGVDNGKIFQSTESLLMPSSSQLPLALQAKEGLSLPSTSPNPFPATPEANFVPTQVPLSLSKEEANDPIGSGDEPPSGSRLISKTEEPIDWQV